MSDEFSTLKSLKNETKKVKQLLNLERFNLLPQDIQIALNDEREAGRIPNPMEPISIEEFEDYKNMMSLFIGDKIASSDEDFAGLWLSQEKAADFITDKEVQKEIAAIAGGIILPTLIPVAGQTTLAPRVAAFITKYPRYAKTIAAFFGGAGGAAPFSDSYIEALGYGAREAAGEGVFQLLSKFFGGRLIKLFRGNAGKNLEDGAAAALKIAEDGGATLTPARLSNSKTIDLLENFAEVSFFGGQRIREAGEVGVESVQKELTKFLNKEFIDKSNKTLLESEQKLVQSFLKNASQAEVDDMLKVFIMQGRDFYKTSVSAAYKALNKQVASTVGSQAKIIDISNLKKVLKRNLNIYYGKNIIPNEGPINSIIKYVEKLPDKVDFNTAKTIRTFLLGKTGAFQVGGTTVDDAAKAVAGALQNSVTKNMDKSIKTLANSGKYSKEQIKAIDQLYKQANSLFKEGKETFNTKFITGLLIGDSQGVTKSGLDMTSAIYKNFVKAGSPSRIKEFYKLLDNGVKNKIITTEAAQTIKNKVQGQFIFDIIGPNTDEISGLLNAKKVLSEVSGFKGKGKGIVDALFKGNEKALGNFKRYLNALNLAQKRGIGSQQGGLALFSGQVKAASTIAGGSGILGFSLSGGDIGSGVSAATTLTPLIVLGGPAVISRMFTNKKFVNSLMNMQLARSGSNQFGRAFTTFINDGITAGFFDIGNAEKVVMENQSVFGDSEDMQKRFPWLKDLDLNDESDEEIINPDIKFLNEFENQRQEEINEVDTNQSFLDEINGETIVEETVSDRQPGLEEAVTTEEIIDVPKPNTEMMSAEIIQPLSSPAGMPFDPSMSTTDKLEEVGLPVFAKHGGIMSLMEQRKPKQMVS